MVRQPSEPPLTHTRTSGGSSDSDVNEFAVIPYGWSPAWLVMTVTPVAKAPIAERNSFAVNPGWGTGGGASAIASLSLSGRGHLDQALPDHPVEVLGGGERLGYQAPKHVAVHREQAGARLRAHGR